MEAAESALLSLQSKTTEALVQSVLSRHLVTEQMLHYLQRLQLDLSSLHVIHVAGTKGKGSTCAFTESVLRHCGLTTGLFTSPHLVHVTERFRINGSTISDELYLKHFWAVWDGLHATASSAGSSPPVPSFFRFLTLVAFHLFVSQSLDVVVLEVGMGGRLDSTNVIPQPIVCGISAIGFDHMEVLGNTLTEIAREKGGIIKPHVPALTIPQPQEVLETLQQCAAEEQATLTVLPLLPSSLALGLEGDHQLENATLAVGLCRHMLEWQAKRGAVGGEVFQRWSAAATESLPSEIALGLKETTWAGRCQRLVDRDVHNVTYYVDGAHTDASMLVACNWFQQQVHKQEEPQEHPACPPMAGAPPAADDELSLTRSAPLSSSSSYNILLFNSGHVRNPFDLLQPVVNLALSDPACQFGHFLACPFDHDRPHLINTPSFDKLVSQQTRAIQHAAVAHVPPVSLSSPSTWQHTLFRVFDLLVAWRQKGAEGRSSLSPACAPRYVYQSSSSQAIGTVRRIAARHPKVHFRVLICGSLYLVGNCLEKLGARIA